ncbi:MAG: hypothetical protein FRX49_03255 [Trebouxia sp. A1-2]|nr:MAG: hypothetical protein FRX49_03255 [Trebouxia sp. A1-2]
MPIQAGLTVRPVPVPVVFRARRVLSFPGGCLLVLARFQRPLELPPQVPTVPADAKMEEEGDGVHWHLSLKLKKKSCQAEKRQEHQHQHVAWFAPAVLSLDVVG